ncbi:MAG: BamA/TamA family outer membrane protein [Chitinophagaceae bacterium]
MDSPSVALPPEAFYTDAAVVVSEINDWCPEMQASGFLEASIDSVSVKGNEYHVFCFTGSKYSWAKLSLDSIPSALLNQAGITGADFAQHVINPSSLSAFTSRILRYCERNGYPFARVWMQHAVEEEPHVVSAEMRVDPGRRRTIDTIIVNGNISVSNSFLHRYLDIPKGSAYNEEKLKKISARLRELPFLQETSPMLVEFRAADTRIVLFLKEKSANQLNAILGLMPNNLQTGKMLLTADIQLALMNQLGQGEQLSASYQNLQAKSPRLKADGVLPYIFRSPVGIEAHFDMFRYNLDFRKVSFQLGARYQLSATEFIKVYYQVMSNRVVEIDSAGIIASRSLTNNIDTRANGFGVEFQANHTDYRYNPHKGWSVRFAALGLQRQVLPNDAVKQLNDGTGFNFASLYDTVRLHSRQYQFSGELAFYLPVSRAFTWKLAYNGAYMTAPQLFQNDLYQLGGFRLLRGFDEQSIFANQYHVLSVEFRLRMAQNSYAYLFSDNGWVQTKFNRFSREAFYNGFGLGTTLETKTGIFSIALAFGRSDYLPLRFKESKLSFGYVALF